MSKRNHKNKNNPNYKGKIKETGLSKKGYAKKYYYKYKKKIKKKWKIYYQKNRKTIITKNRKKYFKKYRLKYKVRIRKNAKKYRKENQENLKLSNKLYYQRNKEKIIKRTKKYYREHKEKIYQYQKIYGQKNKEKIQQKERKQKRKDRLNIDKKIKFNLRCRIWYAIKHNCKSQSTMKLVGCSIKELKQYLKNKFKSGMSWNNYGKWHIDHIRPCCKFDLSNPKKQKKCFNYKNLRPLWAKENLTRKRK